MCGSGSPGTVGGDNILFREATSLEGLLEAPLQVALQPSLDPTKFDQVHACDPNFYRVGDLYYLAYGGNTDGSQLPATTRLGLAVSRDGGRTFQRLHNGNSVLEPDPARLDPNAYGIGQPAVVQAPDGYFYMIYTDEAGDFQLIVRGDPGLDYIIQATPDLLSPRIWSPIWTNPRATTPFTYSEPLSNEEPQRYYQVLLKP